MSERLTQESVLTLMRNGWSAYHSLGLRSCWRLQEGKIGHGGDVLDVHGNVMHALYRKKMITPLPYKAGSFHTEYVVSKEPA